MQKKTIEIPKLVQSFSVLIPPVVNKLVEKSYKVMRLILIQSYIFGLGKIITLIE